MTRHLLPLALCMPCHCPRGRITRTASPPTDLDQRIGPGVPRPQVAAVAASGRKPSRRLVPR